MILKPTNFKPANTPFTLNKMKYVSDYMVLYKYDLKKSYCKLNIIIRRK